ncbi:hypothetical protein PPYR_08296 [Photinus pyralis]|uniref:RAP domain-containing protein n=2 Tax=Photinus pyralis TaxID=7054 RepID=A0A5N4AIX7_PHOPY|nr:FAST kinase domain-containing protein 1, mitochondrial isoform X1 [Photinus pyralis]KAB0797302.1 hypothetical protein PPYR_08296 [Photinus pyralis]
MNCFFRQILLLPREMKCFLKSFRFTKFNQKKCYITISSKLKKVSPSLQRFEHSDTDHTQLDNLDDLIHFSLYNEVQQYQPAKNLLYADSSDPLIVKLKNSVSVQDVINGVNNSMDYTHITQAILVLWDLQKMCYFAQGLSPTEQSGMAFSNHPHIYSLIELAKEKCDSFDPESFSCFLMYANKLGYQLDSNVPQFFKKALHVLSTSTSLTVISRLLNVIRTQEMTFGSLFAVQPAVPVVLQELEKCESLEDLKLITICLQHFHQNVTMEILQKYMEVVKRVISTCDNVPATYRILLKIIYFLNFPKWSDRCTTLSSELALHMKGNLHTLNVSDLCILFETLYKTHEPGELQTEMQRCCRVFLQSGDDESIVPKEMKLKLLSCMASFSSTIHRSDYENVIAEFLNLPLTITSILDLLRIVTFVKSSNSDLDERFWHKTLEVLRQNNTYKDLDILLKVCQKYLNYNNDVHYRCTKFEKCVLNWLHEEFQSGILSVIPSKLSLAAAFIFAFEHKRDVCNAVLNKILQVREQFNHLDVLYLSKGIRNLDSSKNPSVTVSHLKTLSNVLDSIVCNNIFATNDVTQNNFLIKSCVYRRCLKRDLVNRIFFNYTIKEPLSSLAVRNMVIGLQTTGTLVPELVESLSHYVVSHKDCMLGFNAEKVAYLCYYLGYTPSNSDLLFDIIADIIIRDQERLSGLSYIHAAMALCFFHKLPTSWIKQIFNVNFLEKLDFELSMCYFKDKYPIRVRNNMMHLNRAVCLDYPEANVPWFHKKYMEQLQKAPPLAQSFPDIRQYLLHIIRDPEMLVQGHHTAYGYHIDFLLHQDPKGNFIKPGTEKGTRIALLLMKENAYTNLMVQLKGYQQLKKRHLEILGYRVASVNIKKWNSLLYGAERLEFLNNLIEHG